MKKRCVWINVIWILSYELFSGLKWYLLIEDLKELMEFFLVNI